MRHAFELCKNLHYLKISRYTVAKEAFGNTDKLSGGKGIEVCVQAGTKVGGLEESPLKVFYFISDAFSDKV